METRTRSVISGLGVEAATVVVKVGGTLVEVGVEIEKINHVIKEVMKGMETLENQKTVMVTFIFSGCQPSAFSRHPILQ